MILTEDQVDQLIDDWHALTDVNLDTLHEWLGWTWYDYSEWAENGTIPAGDTPLPWR